MELDENSLEEALCEANEILANAGYTGDSIKDDIVSCIVKSAQEIASQAVQIENADYDMRDRKLDRILTGRFTARSDHAAAAWHNAVYNDYGRQLPFGAALQRPVLD